MTSSNCFVDLINLIMQLNFIVARDEDVREVVGDSVSVKRGATRGRCKAFAFHLL